MLSDHSARTAAQLLSSHWQSGTQIDTLPGPQRPANRAEGYAIQAELEQINSTSLKAWKIAATSSAGQAHINVDAPLVGRIFADRILPCDTALPLAGNNMRVAEPEFAFRLARDIPPRGARFSDHDLQTAVASLHPAIELPASRFNDYTAQGAPALIADNACANFFLFADAFSDTWRDLDLATWRVTANVSGQPKTEGRGANVLGSPWSALHWFVSECSERGIMLREGQLVSTGTCAVPIPVNEGSELTVDFGLCDPLTVQFA